MSRLLNRVALVTGAARGSGRSHCARLAQEGADIIALDIPATAEDLAITATLVEKCGRRCVTGLADVRELVQVAAAVEVGVADLGRLDVIVANAGIHVEGAPTWELTEEVWQRTLDVNLTGVWHTVKAAVRHIGREGGSIVIISSTNGLRGTANTAHYTASKHAVVGLARTLANELGPQRIRVNTVHPGAVATRWCSTRRPSGACGPIWTTVHPTNVDTPLIQNDAVSSAFRPDLNRPPTRAEFAEAARSMNLLAVPWVDPVDVANAALFLASDEARYITAVTLPVDAGGAQR